MDNSKLQFWKGTALIIGAWCLGITVLSACTIAGTRVGFVWAMGQDLDWSLLLKQGVGRLVAEQEFSFDHRNPLSGWFYSLVSPLILGHPYGFHIFHLLSSLLLGIAVYGMIWRLSMGRALYLATSVGVIISIWWFWSNYTNVVGLMLFAFSLSAMVVWTYCAYVDSGRSRGDLYAWSLTLWLGVLGLYTIQCGAIIPVFLIGLLRGSRRGLWIAVRDSSPFAVILVIFLAIWVAASTGFFTEPGVAQATRGNVKLQALGQSISYLIWHPIFTTLLRGVWANWPPLLTLGLSVCLWPYLLLVRRMTLRSDDFATKPLREAALWTIVTAIGFAAPTIVLEASSSTWRPGTRSDMLFAAFTPMVALGLAGWIGARFGRRRAGHVVFITSAVIAAFIVPMNFEQNRQGMVAYRWQKNLIDGLAPYHAGIQGPLHFVVINSSGEMHVGNDYAPRLIQDKLNQIPTRWTQLAEAAHTTMRFADPGPAPKGFLGAWKIVFGPTRVFGTLYGSVEGVPRDSVRIFRFDGMKIQPIDRAELEISTMWNVTVAQDDEAAKLATVGN